MRLLLVALVCLVAFECTYGYRGPFRKLMPTRAASIVTVDDDPGEPLFLTPYLEQGQIEKARQLR